jgi:hypothetical protein
MRHHEQVAGGMNKRGAWGSMSQRVSQDAAAQDAEARPTQPQPSGIKHCWVDDEHGRMPGLLLQWRRTESGFQGRVVRPVLDPEWGWVVVDEWLPASSLGPT